MTRFVRTLIASLALAAAVSASGTAFAGEAQDLVQARRTQVAEMLKSAAGTDRDKKVAAVLSSLFDFDAMAKESLGSAWGELNDDQRAEFTAVLKQLVQRTLEKNIRATSTYDVQFLGEEAAEDGAVLVKTRAQNKKNEREEPILIDYRMRKGDAGWRSTDVITEGTSMVGNYRSQFKRIHAKEGFSGLMKKMKDKLKRDGGAALVAVRRGELARAGRGRLRSEGWAEGARACCRRVFLVIRGPSGLGSRMTRTSRCVWR